MWCRVRASVYIYMLLQGRRVSAATVSKMCATKRGEATMQVGGIFLFVASGLGVLGGRGRQTRFHMGNLWRRCQTRPPAWQSAGR